MGSDMKTRLIRMSTAGCIAAVVAYAGAVSPDPQANPDAAVLADFQKRIEQYVELHREMAEGAAELEETEDPARIREAQQRLAARIREARRTAKPGDIFTPEVRRQFRQLMYPEVKGPQGRETRQTIEEDAPASVPLKVNAPYPEGAPLPTVPANVLANLPTLPKELEYRVVDSNLILRDVAANLIVDFIPNAID